MNWRRLPPRVIFFATGLRMRLVFMPLLLLLFLINIGYSISSVAVMDRPNVPNWIATSWYMAVTVIFFAMVISEDTAARLDMLRRGLVVGAVIASLAGIAGYFNLVPGGRDLLTLYDRARGTFKDPNVLRRVPDPAGAVRAAKRRHRQVRQIAPQRDRLRHHVAGDPAGVLARRVGRARSSPPAFMLALMVLTSRSQAQRSRIIVMALVAVVLAAALVAVLLSFDSIAQTVQAARQLRPEL